MYVVTRYKTHTHMVVCLIVDETSFGSITPNPIPQEVYHTVEVNSLCCCWDASLVCIGILESVIWYHLNLDLKQYFTWTSINAVDSINSIPAIGPSSSRYARIARPSWLNNWRNDSGSS